MFSTFFSCQERELQMARQSMSEEEFKQHQKMKRLEAEAQEEVWLKLLFENIRILTYDHLSRSDRLWANRGRLRWRPWEQPSPRSPKRSPWLPVMGSRSRSSWAVTLRRTAGSRLLRPPVSSMFHSQTLMILTAVPGLAASRKLQKLRLWQEEELVISPYIPHYTSSSSSLNVLHLQRRMRMRTPGLDLWDMWKTNLARTRSMMRRKMRMVVLPGWALWDMWSMTTRCVKIEEYWALIFEKYLLGYKAIWSQPASEQEVSRWGCWQPLRVPGRQQCQTCLPPDPRCHHQWVGDVAWRHGPHGGGGGGRQDQEQHWQQDCLHSTPASPHAVSINLFIWLAWKDGNKSFPIVQEYESTFPGKN